MFDKTLTIEKVKLDYENDNFPFIVFESSNEKFYGFNLGNNNERDAAFGILEDEDDFTVIGWKVARKNTHMGEHCRKMEHEELNRGYSP